MTVIDNQVSGSSLSRYGYSYDVLGRRENRQQSGSAFPQTHTDTFAYNLRSEVIGSTNDVLTSPEYAPAYTYDPIGNRRTSTGASSTSYTANALNQYTTVGAASPVHDFDGNLTSNGSGKSYAWNGENRLKTATSGGTTIDFTYDYQGRLVKKDDGTNTEVYVYDDWNRIATFDVQSSTFNVQCVYLWGLDLSGSMQGAGGVGGLLKEGDRYPTYDANGNIMQKLDGTGTAVMSVDYDPFGNIVSGTLVGEYGFSTKPLVEGLDCYYYGFRYYDPLSGRWLSRDPIGERGGINLYHFLYNEPLYRVDYLGLDACYGPYTDENERRRNSDELDDNGLFLPRSDNDTFGSDERRKSDETFSTDFQLPTLPNYFTPCLAIPCREPCNSCCATAAAAGVAWITRSLVAHVRFCGSLANSWAVGACSLAASAWGVRNFYVWTTDLADCVADCRSKPSQQ